MYQPVHEQLARAKSAEHQARSQPHAGIRRSARLISQQIRQNRRSHSN
ncbi:MAG: hypothetical protein WAR57_13240 [Candidatus Phosphoribacter sp.]|nr:hypothetical protein [Actinomycetales bacterium]